MRIKFHAQWEQELPEATDEEIKEWIRFEMRDKGSIKTSNPLHCKDLDPIWPTFLCDWEKK